MQPRHNGQLGDWMCAMELHYKRPAESNCFKLFHGFIFHKDILIKSRIGMLRNVKNILARCLHWVLHWVNLFWWRDLCQPDPGHNWSPPPPNWHLDTIRHWSLNTRVWQLKETRDGDGQIGPNWITIISPAFWHKYGFLDFFVTAF